MATFISKLKAKVYCTVDEVAEWLGVEDIKIDVPQAEVKAFLVIQDLTYIAKLVGVLGNAITIEYKDGVAAVAVPSANVIEVTFPDGTTDADAVKALVDGFPAAAALVDVTVSGTGATAQTSPVAVANLAGGLDDVAFDKGVEERRKRYELLINSATDWVERYIQTNVITRTKQEDLDGNNSNVIVPSHWPIRQINSIFIDFNRNFGAETELDPINFLLRGVADIPQDADVALTKIGNDIALRDDDENNVIGRVFSGSELGSIRVNYEAGWALDADDVPGGIKMATLQIIEFWEFQRSNRTLGVLSKGTMGQSFTKLKDGVPEAVTELLDPYENMTLGAYEKPQINLFGV